MITPPAWLQPELPYLVGISGGRDSIALHHWLVEHQFANLTYCHLNHGLRGNESEQDEQFLRDHLGEKLLSKKIDLAAQASSDKESIETTARRARHRFFQECATRTGCSQVLLAHHAEDQAETILFNLLRGSAGAKGMQSHKKIEGLEILRPFLEVRRDQIEAYLQQKGATYREDSSNQEPFATRNRLRNEAIPLLKDILQRDPVPTLIKAQQQTQDLELIADEFIDTLSLFDPQGRIYLPTFRQLSPPIQRRILHQFLATQGVTNLSQDLIRRGLHLLRPDSSASINLPGGQRLRRKESRLFISP